MESLISGGMQLMRFKSKSLGKAPGLFGSMLLGYAWKSPVFKLSLNFSMASHGELQTI